jgi:dipeptidyl aminopeptidase/acylaminoacyl peptidase
MVLFVAVACVSLAQAAENGAILERSRVTLNQEQRGQVLERVPDAAAYIDSNEVYSITYASDGLNVKGYLIIPEGDGPFPCLIANRGGNRDFGALSDMAAVVWLGRMAHWGYVIVASQYRGVAGGDGMEEFGGAEINDVLNLFPVLDSLPQADATRIGMWGGSRGGLMTYLALAKTDRLKAAVIAAGMCDSYDTVERRPGMEENVYSELVPDWDTNREAALTARSPIRWVDRLNLETPILLLHGTSDWRVHPSQTLNMADSLLAYKHPYRLVMFEGGDHGLTEYRDEEDSLTRDFFDHYVRDNSPLPDMEPHGR